MHQENMYFWFVIDSFTDKSEFFLLICSLWIYLEVPDLNLAKMACVFAQKIMFCEVPFVQAACQTPFYTM